MKAPDPEPLVLSRRCRSTGTRVALYHTPDCDDGPWQTVCEDHGGCVHHQSRRLALQWLSHPEDWCPDCQTQEGK